MSAPERALGTELEATARPIVSPGRRRGWLVRRALAAADVAGLVTSFLVAQWLFAPEGSCRRRHLAERGDPSLPVDAAGVARPRKAVRALRP